MNSTSTSTLPKWLIPSAAIGGLLLVIMFALGILGGQPQIDAGNSPISTRLPAGTATLTVGWQNADNAVAWQGTIRSRQAVKISPKLSARILEINVNPGDAVKQGQVLAKLDDRELRAASNAAHAAQAAAQAQAAQAGAEEKRIQSLYNQQAATRQNLDLVLAQAQAARAMANQAASAAQQSQVMLGENVLTAPFAGVIGDRWQQPGDMANPAQAILSLHKADDLRLEVAIASPCIKQITSGLALPIKVDNAAATLTGVVDEISPEVDPQTLSQLIKLRVANGSGLQHGQFAWLQLACQGPQQALLVPASAVLHYGQLQAVKLVVNQNVQFQHIRTGKLYGEQLEVLSGLQAGDVIVCEAGLQP